MAESDKASRTVVIAFDGSEDANYALDFYCKEIRKSDDHVVLVHCPQLSDLLHSTRWDNSMYTFNRELLEEMLKEEQKKIQEKLDSYAKILQKHGLGGKVKSVLAADVGAGVIQAAEEEGASLMITGCRGLGAVRRTIMGSVSDYIVHHSPVPVIVCRHKKR